MKAPETSRLFEKRINTKNGIEYYVLKERVAPYQQGFYFVNNSTTDNGRYLYFYCSFPPNYSDRTRMLGMIDFEADEIYLLPDALFNQGSPYIDTQTGDAYFTWQNKVFKRTPGKAGKTSLIAVIPMCGTTSFMGTHITMSPDKTELFIDMREGNNLFYAGSLNINTGKFTKWADFDFFVNHAQFNPVNPDLALFAYDFYGDILTGERFSIPKDENGVYQRLWTVTRDGIKTNHAPNNNFASHEWWSADGKKLYYVNFNGIQRLNIETGEHINIHECNPWHAFSSIDESFYVYDEVLLEEGKQWYRGCPAKVKFYNSTTDKEIEIVSSMPSNEYSPSNQCEYHIDPHPRFVMNEKYVLFTTSELGGADVALVNTAQLLKKTR